MRSACGRPVVVPVLPENDSGTGYTVTAAIVTLLELSSYRQAPAAPPP